MRPRLTLAGQLLALQLTIIVLVLVAVAAVSVAQADAGFRRVEGERMRAIAETGASMQAVRIGLADVGRQGILQPTAESLRTLSGADNIIITRPDLRILTSPDPSQIDRRLDIADSPVLSGRVWTGFTTIAGEEVLAAHVPVIGVGGKIIGIVAAAQTYPGLGQRLVSAGPNLLVYLGIAGTVGIGGSLLLARRVKRQTLGFEPAEITRLVEHREAMLHGIKEGVVGLDPQHRITLVNDTAVELLGLPPGSAGRTLDELDVEPEVYDALTGAASGSDQIVPLGDRLVTVNRMPLMHGDSPAGSVTTMRDRTDLVALRKELDVTRTTTEALRAQAHEFSNQLHAISGLLELEEYAEVRQYVSRIGGARARLSQEVTSRVADPSVAALLIAKASLATEQGSELRISSHTSLGLVDEDLSADLVTVIGNLVDNALDAARPGVVEVLLTESDDAVLVRVRDSGPGVPQELREKIFQRGFSTKSAADDGTQPRGYGLAITKVVCARRSGRVEMSTGGPDGEFGAEFVARLPYARPDVSERERA